MEPGSRDDGLVSVVDAGMFLIGLALLVAGGELLVRGSSRLAVLVGISPLVVGLTVVALGTSAPELAVAIQATLRDQGDIALGNVVGSNIFNILFILGITSLISRLSVEDQLVRLDVPVLMAVSVLLLILALDGRLGRVEGSVLFALLIVYIVVLVVLSRRQQADDFPIPGMQASMSARGIATQIGMILGGLALLVLGARWLVDSAVTMARSFGVSELIIGLTVVAAGTGAPEVATSVIATIRGQRDIAVGNVIGSSIFNILAVLGLTSIVASAGVPVATAALSFDIPVMLAASIACLPIFFTGGCVERWEGLVFLGYYIAYVAYLILDATGHDALQGYSLVMLAFVIPLTVITLLLLSIRTMQQNVKRGRRWSGRRKRRD
jgi:cation:H+ antiporter